MPARHEMHTEALGAPMVVLYVPLEQLVQVLKEEAPLTVE